MHEYSVVRELLSLLLPRLEGVPGAIETVFLRKGELLVLSDRALEGAFEVLAAGTRLEGARLSIEPVEACLSCPSCGYEGPAERLTDEAFHFAIPILSCPRCKGEVEVVSGRELAVDRVEVSTPEEASPAAGAQGAPWRSSDDASS